MFSIFTARLCDEVDTIKHVLDTHNRFRTLVFDPIAPLLAEVTTHTDTGPDTILRGQDAVVAMSGKEQEASKHAKLLDQIRSEAPSRSYWQVYDHCAAFTRLYAVYEQFVTELVSDYLRILPELYEKYDGLPENVLKQHRLGIGQILQKLGRDGPFKNFDERQIIQDLAHGLSGDRNYKLLCDAFLIDPQNYRAEVLGKIFCYLGINNCWNWIEGHPLVISFMDRERDRNDTAATVLDDFVKYRNEAAHTSVSETVSTEELKSIANCIVVVCQALAQLVMKQVVLRREELGHAILVGEVLHKFSDCIVGVKMRAGTVSIGDELIVMHKHLCCRVGIRSIQIEHTPHDRLDVIDNQEIGLGLTIAATEGVRLLRFISNPEAAVREPAIELLSPDDYPITAQGEAPPPPIE